MSVIKSEGPIVVKIGGSTLGVADTTIKDLITLHQRGVGVVVVHGGGATINEWLDRSGVAHRFVHGLRVTDHSTLQTVVAVLTGLVNKQLVASLNSELNIAVGICGADGSIFRGNPIDPDLGYVGKVSEVRVDLILCLLDAGYIPIVAPVAIGEAKDADLGLLNLNGDTAAGELAVALKAERLLFLTDVEGVLDSFGCVLTHISKGQAKVLISNGVVEGGMIPKLQACVKALPHVGKAQILDGRKPYALLECLEGQSLGTEIV